MNRILGILRNIEHPNPSTPDEQVSPKRKEGRAAARKGLSAGANPYVGAQSGRTDWYLGWYDERLKRYYP